MHSRPIVNTRDEPHADPEKYRRLHVIVGDANMAEYSTYLKMGTMAVVLSMVEDDFIEPDLSVDGPVAAFRKVSRDLGCRDVFRLKDGRTISAVDHQREYLALAQRYYRDREHEPWVRELMTRWENTLDRLAEDPMQLGRELDWVIKHQLIENYVAKHELEWNDHRVQMIDLQYHDIHPGKGLYYKLEESDAVDRLVTDDEIAKAIYDPPKDTRAYFRGMCLQRYSDEIVSASWDSVIFDLKEGPLKKIFMLEPLRGTEAHVRQLLTESPTAADLLRNIGRPSYRDVNATGDDRRTMTDDHRLYPFHDYVQSSFVELLRRQSPHLLPGADPAPAVTEIPHGTTVLAVRYRDGVIMAGDRQATAGYQVASRRIEKIFKADDLSGVGIAGAAGPAMEMAKLFQTELEHYEKVEGDNLSLDGKANKLGQMIRMNLQAAMMGLAVVPIFAGFDEKAGVGRLFKYDITGGRYEERDYDAQGSGSKDARDSLKKLWKRDMPRDEALRTALEALIDAADEDVGTGGPDLVRGIFPTVKTDHPERLR